MDDAFLWSKPSELAVRHKPPPETGHVGGDLLQGEADHMVCQQLDRGHAQLGASTDGEGEPMASQAGGMIRVQNDVRSRVIGVGIHRVRSVQRPGGREADVARGRTENPCRHPWDPSYMLKLRCLSTVRSLAREQPAGSAA